MVAIHDSVAQVSPPNVGEGEGVVRVGRAWISSSADFQFARGLWHSKNSAQISNTTVSSCEKSR